ncbi:hypothetical protein GCM10010294_00680 [Streptomyces griseoloalbus]|uniref:hypothetical protein n=1 Tax=Streptomyces griseoloalbus TaxID=67303 RepID=UPI001875F928|nr:hypothetical protein GCM10010294_00680 [Streptomyces griseoloalbus]
MSGERVAHRPAGHPTFPAVNGVGPGGVDQETAYTLVVDLASGRGRDVRGIAKRLRRL